MKILLNTQIRTFLYRFLNVLVGIWPLLLWRLPRLLREELVHPFCSCPWSFVALLWLLPIYIMYICLPLEFRPCFYQPSYFSSLSHFPHKQLQSIYILTFSTLTHTHTHTHSVSNFESRHFSLFGLLLYLQYLEQCLGHRVCVELWTQREQRPWSKS